MTAYFSSRSTETAFLVLWLALFCTLTSCRSPMELTSSWKQSDIVIDGNNMDWQGFTTVLSSHNGTIGVLHDNDFLYLCFTTTERQFHAQMVGFGFTVWFDPDGGNNKIFGIHFPLGFDGGGRALMSQAEENTSQMLERFLDRIPPQLELLGPGADERHRVSVAQASGISVRLGRSQDALVYELKVPLKKSDQSPWALTIDPTKPLGIGLETSEPSRDRLQNQRAQAAPARGGRGGRGGGGGATAANPGQEPPQLLKLWTRVTFATKIM